MMESITPRRSLRLMQKEGIQIPSNSIAKGLPTRLSRTPKSKENSNAENTKNSLPSSPPSTKRNRKRASSTASLNSMAFTACPSSPLASNSDPIPSSRRSPMSPQRASPLHCPSSPLSVEFNPCPGTPPGLVSSTPPSTPPSSSKIGVSSPLSGISSPPTKRRMKSPSSPHVAFTPSPSGTSRKMRPHSSLVDEATLASSPHTPTKRPPKPILNSPKVEISPTVRKVMDSGSEPHLERLKQLHTQMNAHSPRHVHVPPIKVTPRKLKFKTAEQLIEPHYYSPTAKPSRRLSKSPENLPCFRDMRTGKPLTLGDYKSSTSQESDEEYDSEDIDQFISGGGISFDDGVEDESSNEEDNSKEGKRECNSEDELPSSGHKRKRTDSETRLQVGGDDSHMAEYLRHGDEGLAFGCTVS